MSGRDHPYLQAEGVPQGTAQVPDQQARIRRIAEPILGSLGLVLVDVEMRGRGPNSLVRVVIERPVAGQTGGESVTVQDCERAHVLVGHALDADDPIAHRYVLEVSSPGLDRPIRNAGEYERFRGRLARFKLAPPVAGLSVVTGRIMKLEEGRVVIEYVVGHGRRTETRELALPLADIREARLEVEF
ncbi:MAG: ribosome maturation factor RimP [Nitrospirae bacterium]|nr:MAG: ribosome maturation factor RimP [Nitrospirota bacterium]